MKKGKNEETSGKPYPFKHSKFNHSIIKLDHSKLRGKGTKKLGLD